MELLCQQDTKEAFVTQHLPLLMAAQPLATMSSVDSTLARGEEHFMSGRSSEFNDVSSGSRLCPSAKEPNALQ